jgi:toxin ParE1/3/4
MLLEWRPEARAALREILSFISERNLVAAFSLGDEIERATSALPQHPYLYRHGKVAGTREMVVHPNYVVIYRVTSSAIEIINVLHSRQQYP